MALADSSTLVIDDEDSQLKEHQNAIGGYRAFCGNCGTRLMNYAPDKSMYLSVTLSSIDTPIDFKPVAHVNVKSKANWCTPCEDIPSFDAIPEGIV